MEIKSISEDCKSLIIQNIKIATIVLNNLIQTKPSNDAKKAIASVGGLTVATGGIITVMTGGFGSVVLGGAMLGAGISSTIHGVEKTIKKEDLQLKPLAADIVFGASTGVLSGGIGAVGEVAAANVARTVIVRSAAGALSGIGAKSIAEIREIVTNNKKLSDFGKELDKEGKSLGIRATAASWITSATIGAVGSAVACANLSKYISSQFGQSATRIGVSAVSAATCDTISQTVNIMNGTQDEFSGKRLATTVVASAATTAAFEGVKNVNYSMNGGKDKYLQEKSNEKMIKEDPNIPLDKKQQIIKNAVQLNEIEQNKIENDLNKPIPIYYKKHNNAHILKGKHANQMAVDVKDSSQTGRGTHRAGFDIHQNNDKSLRLEYSGYISDHDYTKLPKFGYRQIHHKINRDIFENRGYIFTRPIINEEFGDDEKGKEKFYS